MSTNNPTTHQVFVSYAHADDRPFEDEGKGWVSRTIENLINSVARQSGGGQVDFWMDHRLEEQREVDVELQRKIIESKVILAFLSPRYLESEWCRKEMRTFIELVGKGGPDNRVFLIEVLPTNRQDWDDGIKNLTENKFWSKNLVEPEPMTLGWPAPDTKKSYDYWGAINKLATRLARQIKGLPSESQAMSELAPPPPLPPPPLQQKQLPIHSTRTVWLAEPTDDVAEPWETLRKTLLDAGHAVLPEAGTGYDWRQEAELRQALASDLGRADLLLQLLGAFTGKKPEWSEHRITQIQATFAQASAEARQLDFRLWRPPSLTLENIPDATYRALLDKAGGMELEDFAQQVLQGLRPKTMPATGQPLSVLINADALDRELGKQAQGILEDLDVDAALAPIPEPDMPAPLYRELLETTLHNTDGVLIVYGQASPIWVHAQYSRARKVLAQERKGIWAGLLEAPPEAKPETGLSMRYLQVLDCRQGIQTPPLAAFVQTLRG